MEDGRTIGSRDESTFEWVNTDTQSADPHYWLCHRITIEIFDIGTDDFNELISFRREIEEIVKSKQPGGMGLKLVNIFMFLRILLAM